LPPTTTPPLKAYRQGSCVVVVSTPFARVSGALWIDGLHLVLVDEPIQEGARLKLCEDDELSVCEVKREGSGDHSLIKVSGSLARLWVTNVVMQVLPLYNLRLSVHSTV
jgi:hypothetical protein